MKKTTDGRIIDERILIAKSTLKKIIYLAKERSKLSWPKFSKMMGVSIVTLQHDWLLENRTIPKLLLNKLIKISDYNGGKIFNRAIIKKPFWGQKLIGDKLKFKQVKIPDKNSKKFAEFYGIMLGDGCVFSDLRGFSISGDKFLDYFYYHDYLKNLIFDLFGIFPSIYTSKHDRSIKCLVYSALIARFLKETGFPIGLKYIHNPIIPNFLNTNQENLSYCIRGIMDTDGSLSAHPNSKIMIHLSITMPFLRNCVKLGLEKFEIIAGEFNKGLMIYGNDKIRKFNDNIGFSNFKNVYKYEYFIKNGKVPSSKAVEMFIRAKGNI